MEELRRHKVDLRLNTFAEREDVLAEEPELVIVASGGLPRNLLTGPGAELTRDTWEVMGGGVRLSGDVLVYDNHGGHAALDAAEQVARAGARVELVTPERTIGPDVGVIGIDPYLAVFAEKLVRLTPALYLRSVRRENGRLVATLWSEYADVGVERIVDYVVVEHGTMPHDDLYFDLVADSSNLGEVDHEALIKVQPQSVVTNQNGR